MNFNEYQEQALSTIIFSKENALDYLTNAMASEVGELCGKYAKIIRDKDKKISETDRIEMIKEVGDVLWDVAVISKFLGFSLEETAQGNLDKLASRKERGVLGGSGDNR
jgi:NTP pyrophosphatase (non-canonical NTP hydrolase)